MDNENNIVLPEPAPAGEAEPEDRLVRRAWYGTYLMCGGCGWTMDSSMSDHTVTPMIYKARCGNQACPNYNVIFVVDGRSSVRLRPA